MNSLFSRSQLETSFSLVFIAILCSFEVLKIQIFRFLKRLLYRVKTQIEAFGQTVLPDRSILIGQKLVETAKTQKLRNETILSHIQTLCVRKKSTFAELSIQTCSKDYLFMRGSGSAVMSDNPSS